MIKKIIVLSHLLLTIGGCLLAQNQKGNLSIGTSLGFHVQFDRYYTFFTYQFNPKIGFFINENLNVGMDLNFHPYNELFQYESKALGPYIRYLIDFSNFNFFIESSFRYDFGDYYDGINLSIGPGLSFKVNDFISIENILLYQADSRFGHPTTHYLYFNLGITLYFIKYKMS